MSPFSRFAHYFIAVARYGSLRRAAEQLHISASAINRQILQAEEAFGTPLFERLSEGLRMTTAGELLYDNLLRWQKEFRQTRQKFDELQGMKRGSVSVGMVQALAEGGFAAALAEIIASWPWLELDLQVADSHTVSQKVRQADPGRRPDPRSAGAGWTQRAGLCRTGGGDCDASGPSPGGGEGAVFGRAQPGAAYRARRAVDRP